VTVSGDGVASAALVSAGATMLVKPGADCVNATLFGSGELDVQGEASGTVIQGGVEVVTNGAASA
jgi:autotransporter passenger strand-loop-strand repeat protein